MFFWLLITVFSIPSLNQLFSCNLNTQIALMHVLLRFAVYCVFFVFVFSQDFSLLSFFMFSIPIQLFIFELFFCKKIPLSRRVEYVMDGSMDQSVSQSVSE